MGCLIRTRLVDEVGQTGSRRLSIDSSRTETRDGGQFDGKRDLRSRALSNKTLVRPLISRLRGDTQGMAGLFFRQLGALFWKNWIVLGKHPFVSSFPDHSRSFVPTCSESKTAEHHPVFHSARRVRGFPFGCTRVLRQKE